MWCITYLGNTIDAFDTYAEAQLERELLVSAIKAGRMPNFLDPEDIDGVGDFPIRFDVHVS